MQAFVQRREIGWNNGHDKVSRAMWAEEVIAVAKFAHGIDNHQAESPQDIVRSDKSIRFAEGIQMLQRYQQKRGLTSWIHLLSRSSTKVPSGKPLTGLVREPWLTR